ncbi:beta-ketoacyl synthase N-terminal-like domain-containing protein [Clostridium sp. E02]|uniref:beta-ketoacyl synthase N-terminal-like domain-containing protein n=1 Tax=Clostridium sp. E02 TaxID=2487134 RepID=UPI000F52AA5F|nr:beta-ketoacyl synthase N-terminal-like domain-containing protein [Clostridium sp. E02]
MKKLINLKSEESETINNNSIAVEDDIIRDIAIIGVSAKLPMAENAQEFWDNIRNGCDCVSKLPNDRKKDLDDLIAGLKISDVEYRKLAYVSNIDKFDFGFFGISHREASLMDPNQRIFLETVWGAIEDSGYGGNNLIGSRTGVFLGYGSDSEYQMFVNTFEPSYTSVSLIGNIAPNIASRISYIMNFKGPNLLINTTCSSALVALHIACQSLKNRECSQAVVGGIKLILLPIKKNGDMGVQSSDGKTRTFDDNSDGMGSGEGSVAVILKPLEKALKDRDHVYAIIKGSAVNHDGNSISMAAPNPAAQEDVIVRAWKDANIDPNTISYIEAHGTGTKLGDPIEIEGIQKAFSRYTDKKQFCAIGSVKSNINHLDSVSGLVGLLKTVFSLKNKEIPQTIHFKTPNRNIDFANSPVYVNNQLRPWKVTKFPRRCGVSSFGMSGTNCHVVLEEAPSPNICSAESNYHILALSAKSKNSLKELVACYIDFLKRNPTVDIRNLCFTANTGRGHYNHRIAIIATDITNLLTNLQVIYDSDLEQFLLNDIYCGEVKKNSDCMIDSNDITKIASYDGHNQDYMNELGHLYIAGVKINWDEIYSGEKFYKLSLPTYCFEKTRCWLDIHNKISNIKNNVNNDVNDMFYEANWIQKEVDKITDRFTCGSILMFHDGNNKQKEIAQKLKNYGFYVKEILGSRDKDIVSLVDILKTWKDEKIQVLHCTTIKENRNETNSIRELEDNLDKGVYSLQRILVQISHLKQKIDLVLISEYAYHITKREKCMIPENAVLFGFGKNIHNEDHNITCRCIDVDEDTTIDNVINEILAKNNDYSVAYRENKRYVEEIQRSNMDLYKQGNIKIKENGVYVVTGGLGNVGMEVCKYISSKNHANIMIINRSGFLDKSLWDKVNDEDNEKLVKQIKTYRELEKNGSNIEIYTGDITKEDELKVILDKIHKRHGMIHGIFHCAAIGVGKRGLRIIDEEPQKLNYTMGPKIQGTWLLDKLTQDDKLDFLVLFSSAITLMGGNRAAAYVASNTYLDSYAYYGEEKGNKIITIDWPTWSDIALSSVNDNHLFLPFVTKDAIEILDKALNTNMIRCIVGKMNSKSDLFLLGEKLPFKLSHELKEEINANKVEEQSKNINITIKGREDGNYSKTEQIVANVIGNVLAVNEIDINESFFDLGGSSITSIKIEADFESLGIPFESSDIYDYNTVAEIARFVKGVTLEKDKERLTIDKKSESNQTKHSGTSSDIKYKIDNLKGNYGIFYKSCFYNSLFPIIDHFNKDITAFLSNDIITYEYLLNEQDTNILDINYTEINSFEQLIDTIGLKFTAHYYVSNVEQDIIRSISNKKPVLLYVDCYYASIREDCFNKNHLAHTWLIKGVDSVSKTFHIIEHQSHDSLKYTEKMVGYQELVNAYIGFNDYYNMDETQYSYYEFSPKLNDSLLETKDYRYTFVQNMIHNKSMVNNGLKKLEQFAKDYPGFISDEIQYKKSADILFDSINHIINAKKIEEFRWLRLFGDKQDDLVSLIKDIIISWNKIRVKIGKCNYTSIYRKDTLATTIKEMKRIVTLENDFFNKQFSIIENIKIK